MVLINNNDVLMSDSEVSKSLENLGFGNVFTEHMVHLNFKGDVLENYTDYNKGWSKSEVVRFKNISLSPAAAVLHYAQEIFEGMKAYKWNNGSVYMFRPFCNAKRFNKSARRLALPCLDENVFVSSIKDLIKRDKRWIPTKDGESLYIRPFMIATEPFLGVRPAQEVDFYSILSPVGNYFGTIEPVKIWVETNYFRSSYGGTGDVKCGGNYASSLLPGIMAKEKGCSQVLYLNSRDQKNIEELGGMSFFVVLDDMTIVTPMLNGNILESITRQTIIELTSAWGYKVEERELTIDEVVKSISSGRIIEMFACGTAAVVAPIGTLLNDKFEVSVDYHNNNEGELTTKIRNYIVDVQTGKLEDKYQWMEKVCD